MIIKYYIYKRQKLYYIQTKKLKGGNRHNKSLQPKIEQKLVARNGQDPIQALTSEQPSQPQCAHDELYGTAAQGTQP